MFDRRKRLTQLKMFSTWHECFKSIIPIKTFQQLKCEYENVWNYIKNKRFSFHPLDVCFFVPFMTTTTTMVVIYLSSNSELKLYTWEWKRVFISVNNTAIHARYKCFHIRFCIFRLNHLEKRICFYFHTALNAWLNISFLVFAL